MNILSFGSLNLDVVYSVAHIARPQETLLCTRRAIFCGGKGLNQTAAAAAALRRREEDAAQTADIMVLHAGCVGNDGARLVDELRRAGADTRFVREVDEPTGHAIIQVGDDGQNAIVIHGGANRAISDAHITEALRFCAAGDIALLQNEINGIADIITAAAARGMRIFFNAAPCDSTVKDYPLHLLHTLVVNEIEGQELSGDAEPRRMIDILTARYPRTAVIVTIGDKGALYGRGSERHHAPAHPFEAVDTTAAGDTFAGYYAALAATGSPPPEAIRIACCAASLSITKEGATASIPPYFEVARHL